MEIKFKRWNCKIAALYYSTGPTETTKARKAMLLLDVENNQLVTKATVNMPDYPCEENQVYIKDYSENEGMLQALIDNNIILPHPINILSGNFVAIPLVQLTPEALKLWEK